MGLILGTDDNTSDYIMEGHNAIEAWMKKIGLVMNLSGLGVTDEMIERIANRNNICERISVVKEYI